MIMARGKCLNCWWWKEEWQCQPFQFTNCQGTCHFQNAITCKDSWCPDFITRRKGNKEMGTSLNEWINKQK